MELTSDFFQQASKVLTVTELTRSIRNTLEVKFGAVWVQGEISNYKLHPSGHQYFTLKDARAQIACVIFRNAMPPPRFASSPCRMRIGSLSILSWSRAAAAASKTYGSSTKRLSREQYSIRRCRLSRQSVTKSILRSAILSRIFARQRRALPRN